MDAALTTSFAGIPSAPIGAAPTPRVPSESQRAAIEAEPQPLLVRAGPGAGKTYCLIERIRFLIDKREFDPGRICVFTFTNKAAGEIASRLDSELGPRVESVRRGTIHSFCSDLLREYGDQVGLQEGFGIADELYQLALLRRLKVPRKLHKSVLDAFARYRIKDPLRFFQTLGSKPAADSQLNILLNSALRRVLGESTFIQVVRDERADLMARIRDLINHEAASYGIEVVDARIRRADLPEQNSQAVYQRMQTARQREAAEYRAQGLQQAQEIRSKADREVTVLVADATSKSEQIRGEGDATRNKIFADAFNKDPDFFSFYRSMQAYEIGLKPNDTRMVLNPDSKFFRYFNDPSGKPVSPAPADAAPAAK